MTPSTTLKRSALRTGLEEAIVAEVDVDAGRVMILEGRRGLGLAGILGIFAGVLPILGTAVVVVAAAVERVKILVDGTLVVTTGMPKMEVEGDVTGVIVWAVDVADVERVARRGVVCLGVSPGCSLA